MRRAWMLSVLFVSACATSGSREVPIAPGGSVSDFDRGGGAGYSPDTGTPAGARGTIGVASTNGSQPRGLEDEAPPAPPPASRDLVAGPMQARSQSPEAIRSLQRALAERGYFQGPLSGASDPALVDAVRRFQADRGLPITGRLDRPTADALGLPPPGGAPPSPHGG